MTAFLSDSFAAATGLVHNRTPNTGPGGTWQSASATQQGGVYCAGGLALGDGYYSAPTLTDSGNMWFDFSPTVATASLETVASLTLGSVIDGESSFTALKISHQFNGRAFQAVLRYDASIPSWTARVYDGSGTGSTVNITSGISIGGTVTYTFTVEDGAQSLVIDCGGANVFTATHNSAYVNNSGLSQTELLIGGFTGVSAVSVDSASAAPAGVATFSGTAALPVISFTATGEPGQASANLVPPMAALFSGRGTRMDVGLTPPGPSLYSYGHASAGDQAAVLVAPSPTLTITTGASANPIAPSPTLSTRGTVTGLDVANLTAPAPTLAATCTVAATATISLAAPSPNLVGYGGAVCSITLTGSPAVSATGTTGGIGGAQVTCPLFQLTATATAQNRGGANLLAPSPRLGQTAQAWLVTPGATLTAIGSAVVTATYEAYAVNLKHTPKPGVEPVDEMTRYTNFPFTHVVRYKNSYYGANSTGLFLLEGTVDVADPISYAVKTAMTDFKSPTMKTLASAYLSGRFGPTASLQLHAGEDGATTYSYTTPRSSHAQNYRQAFGRGMRARYYAMSVSGTDTCELDGIELDIHNLTRRI